MGGSCSFLKQQDKLQRMPNLSACVKVQTMLNCFTGEWISGNVSELKAKKLQIPPACVDGLEEWNAVLKRKDWKLEISNFKIECSKENSRREGIKESKKQNRKIFCQAISK